MKTGFSPRVGVMSASPKPTSRTVSGKSAAKIDAPKMNMRSNGAANKIVSFPNMIVFFTLWTRILSDNGCFHGRWSLDRENNQRLRHSPSLDRRHLSKLGGSARSQYLQIPARACSDHWRENARFAGHGDGSAAESTFPRWP